MPLPILITYSEEKDRQGNTLLRATYTLTATAYISREADLVNPEGVREAIKGNLRRRIERYLRAVVKGEKPAAREAGQAGQDKIQPNGLDAAAFRASQRSYKNAGGR